MSSRLEIYGNNDKEDENNGLEIRTGDGEITRSNDTLSSPPGTVFANMLNLIPMLALFQFVSFLHQLCFVQPKEIFNRAIEHHRWQTKTLNELAVKEPELRHQSDAVGEEQVVISKKVKDLQRRIEILERKRKERHEKWGKTPAEKKAEEEKNMEDVPVLSYPAGVSGSADGGGERKGKRDTVSSIKEQERSQ
eukprot:CAMPEP_0195506716 /NCGR_PEP_ID=MMETSP0794_2-20130614/297_1 /TAXON_ID=515487 /ORGANISM="Stephanopyxis turris, Strain CCMP 815" /LENGTH=192 /DNA_ID=CAMNT_0040633131 /DNA_START=153 /DNA_END=731 /DNA_ORIENTATION=+